MKPTARATPAKNNRSRSSEPYVAGDRIRLDPSMVIGSGGEADVYDLGDSRALKLFKTENHPDLDGMPDEQAAARMRLAVHQKKLPDFPDDLPERVVVPRELATSRRRGGAIVGYTMAMIPGAELLYRYSEPRVRRTSVSGNQVVGVLGDLRDTVEALHRQNVVIGDFNDRNVLVLGQAGQAHLIDSDSFQFGSYLCPVYSERFVDPLLCDPGASSLVLARHHQPSSDWYAFTVMAMRSLLCVGPYGGVYRPKDRSKRISHGARPLHRITVFDPEVVYPRPALHYGLLPDELAEHFRATFVDDRRVPFPVALLDDLRWTRCRQCHGEHARVSCPACRGKNGKRPSFSRVRGRVTAREVVVTDGVILAVTARNSEARDRARSHIPARAATAHHGRDLDWLVWNHGRLENREGTALAVSSPDRDGHSLALSPRRHVLVWQGSALFIEDGRVRTLSPVDTQARGDRTPTDPRSALRLVDTCVGDSSAVACIAANQRHLYWLARGRLWRDDRLGEIALGDVLAGRTRFWVGERFGVGFYRAGALSVGFVFDAEHPGIDDSLALPRIRGQLVAAHAVVGDTRAWMWWMESHGGRTSQRCVLIARDGRRARIVARATTSGHSRPTGASLDPHSPESGQETGRDSLWLESVPGACAVGECLFVPTDRGIVRVEADGDRLRVTRSFPDTEPFVDAASRLLVTASGLHAVSAHRIVHLALG